MKFCFLCISKWESMKFCCCSIFKSQLDIIFRNFLFILIFVFIFCFFCCILILFLCISVCFYFCIRIKPENSFLICFKFIFLCQEIIRIFFILLIFHSKTCDYFTCKIFQFCGKYAFCISFRFLTDCFQIFIFCIFIRSVCSICSFCILCFFFCSCFCCIFCFICSTCCHSRLTEYKTASKSCHQKCCHNFSFHYLSSFHFMNC